MERKTAVIIGVGPGIGMAVARRFGREGYEVALVARRAEALATYKAALERDGIRAHVFPADASDSKALAAAFQAIRSAMGSPQVLVYNASMGRQSTASQLRGDQFLREFRVNAAAALEAAQMVIPEMRAKRRGTILFTGGGLALEPHPQYASLSVGKAGIRALALALAAELAPENIHVAAVTVCGFVQPGTRLDPDLIAAEYWRLHVQPTGQFEREALLK